MKISSINCGNCGRYLGTLDSWQPQYDKEIYCRDCWVGKFGSQKRKGCGKSKEVSGPVVDKPKEIPGRPVKKPARIGVRVNPEDDPKFMEGII